MNQKIKYIGLLAIIVMFTIALTLSNISYVAAENVDNQDAPSDPVTSDEICGKYLCVPTHGENVGSEKVYSHNPTGYKTCGYQLCSEPTSEVEVKIVAYRAPYIEEVEIIVASANSENMFKVTYKAYAGERNIGKMLILVESDSETVYMTSGGIWEGDHDLITIRIQALDKDSISSKILSWEIND